MTRLRWTSSDLELLPLNEGKRYEIIDGELYVTTQPSFEHQYACGRLGWAFIAWDRPSRLGIVLPAPGIIFPDDDNVAPDFVWIERSRLAGLIGPDHKLHAAPDLVVEVLSPGPENQRRDREIKLNLYSRRGVREYWIVNWEQREVEVYRRQGDALALVATELEQDSLQSPLLPGFTLPVSELFLDLQAV